MNEGITKLNAQSEDQLKKLLAKQLAEDKSKVEQLMRDTDTKTCLIQNSLQNLQEYKDELEKEWSALFDKIIALNPKFGIFR